MFSKNIKYLTITLLISLTFVCNSLAIDLIANRETIEAEGGNYGFVIARNEAKIIIEGDVHLTGQMSVTGNSSITINNGSITGATQITVDASSRLTMSGNISAETVSIAGTLKLNDGELIIEADTFVLEEGAILDANGVGENTQGQGGSGWHGAGGSYGGKGGAGYHAGDVKDPYGDPSSLSIEVGSPGGRDTNESGSSGGKGGGKVQITANSIFIRGTITANGANGIIDGGGGSGGGITIHSKDNLELTGSITAEGSKADNNNGGGGGGRIKIFYHTGTIDDSATISVNGGRGYRSGSPGTIFCNIAPEPPAIIAPEDNASVSNQPTFQFSVTDQSETIDTRTQIPGADGGHLDELTCRVELSQDGFKTISHSFDQDVSLSGWSDISYTNGDTAEFTPPEPLLDGTYQWRVTAFDSWLRSHPSEVRTFTVGELIPGNPPVISEVSPDHGPTVGGTEVMITGENFVDGAIVKFGENEAYDITVLSNTEITAETPATEEAGTVDVRVINPDQTSGVLRDAFRYEAETTGIFTARVALTRGINMISLPLRPDISYTASSLAAALNSTIVIQVKDGHFDAYIRAGSIGTDFPIQMGKGYIVNLMEAQTFNITGKPWGEPVPVAPPINMPAEPWAFVIAGQIEGQAPAGGQMRVTNLRTKESIVAPISPSSQFTAAFVDMSQRPVVSVGDEFILQLIGANGTSKLHVLQAGTGRLHVLQDDIALAYLLTRLSAKPEQTRLLQNYPNPFNPETWIPFQLAKPVNVTIHIYNARGQLIRTLSLGQQNAGFYLDRSKAAYWNGRNTSGEKVASGLYFYQLKAGDFTATRRMVIVK